jgi:hypothetical protein
MVEPIPHHPQLLGNLDTQYSISNGLFCLMLETNTTRAEIGRSWVAISQEIDAANAQDIGRQNQ